jgi:hypothetical protein
MRWQCLLPDIMGNSWIARCAKFAQVRTDAKCFTRAMQSHRCYLLIERCKLKSVIQRIAHGTVDGIMRLCTIHHDINDVSLTRYYDAPGGVCLLRRNLLRQPIRMFLAALQHTVGERFLFQSMFQIFNIYSLQQIEHCD